MTLALDRRARLWPDRTAVIDHTDRLRVSYAELDDRAAAATGRLAAHGLEPGETVVVLRRNHVDLIALLFGARRLGVTLAPISHRLPRDTVSALRERIEPALTIVEDGYVDRVGGGTSEPVLTPGEFAELDPAAIDAEPIGHPPLYLHTGGTTGVPKVVVISERQLEWNCITEAAAWGLGKDTVSPILLPMYHTGGWNLLLLPTIYVGGTVVLQREFDPEAALDLIETHGATQVFGVAAVFQAMAATDGFESTDFSTVDWFMSGGGPTPERLMDAYRDRGQTFVQGYGLTEGGPNNLYLDPTREDAPEKPDSVGRPFPDCEVRVVDEADDPVEPGAVGELEVRGPVAADRYLETTDGTFEGDWVSTGDLVRADDDGDLYIVGRTDNMFVSGGENVHPEAIERALERHPDVEAVGVVGVPHDRWGRVPKAVVVGALDAETLEAYAREHLPGHEVPKRMAFADALPRSGPGKLDREALERRYGE